MPFSFLRMHASQLIEVAAFAAVADGFEMYQPESGHIVVWSEDGEIKWGGTRHDCWIMDFSYYRREGQERKAACAISAEGDVLFFEDETVTERIPGAGIESEDSAFHGRMNSIAGIGAGLYACGSGGQSYARGADGGWASLAPELLQGPDVSIAETDEFECIDGPAEDDIYIVGARGRMLHFDGNAVTALPVVTDGALIKLCVESADRIWACGTKGTLLVGNARDGFQQVPGIAEPHHFNSVTRFEGRIYLASALGGLGGIYTYDDGRLERVETGLKPDVTGMSHVDAGAGLLWAANIKDIVRFDGRRWERIDCPYNEPVR